METLVILISLVELCFDIGEIIAESVDDVVEVVNGEAKLIEDLIIMRWCIDKRLKEWRLHMRDMCMRVTIGRYSAHGGRYMSHMRSSH